MNTNDNLPFLPGHHPKNSTRIRTRIRKEIEFYRDELINILGGSEKISPGDLMRVDRILHLVSMIRDTEERMKREKISTKDKQYYLTATNSLRLYLKDLNLPSGIEGKVLTPLEYIKLQEGSEGEKKSDEGK